MGKTKTELQPGSFLGKYRIERLIGTGAMAEVYQAHHPDLNRHVAIKRLHAFLAVQTDMLDRFRREAQHIATLMHRNIVQVFDFDVIDSIYYMVMEYIDGEPLKQIMNTYQSENERFPMSEALRIARDVGTALAYAHSHNVVHRDVKPANIMLDKNSRVVLADFGLARLLAGPQYTSAGTIVGTPSYMSPEQGRGQQGDARSDIYALGALLYELVAGAPPFTGETPVAVIFKHVNAPVPPPRLTNPEISEGLEQVILRALEKDPDDRYPAADDMVADLDILVDEPLSRGERPQREASLAAPGPPAGIRVSFPDDGREYELVGKQRYIIGRLDGAFQPDIDFGAREGAESGVSRLHAEIEITDSGQVEISDLDSTNGTWVNGNRVSPASSMKLNHGDMVRIGRCTLQIMFIQ